MNDARGVIVEALTGAQTPCLTSSFQAECVVLTHMLRSERPDVPVLFLDTFHHFAETLKYRDDITQSWGAESDQPACRGAAGRSLAVGEHGGVLRAPQGEAALLGARRVRCLVYGAPREQSPSRAGLQEIEPFRLPSGKTIQRVSPLATWTAKDVRAYAKRYDIPLLPLYDLGYTSIGCEPCTSLPLDPSDPRSGRWQGQKLECGIHIEASKP